jgi:threonine/homoserine efflux transporter RhtA
MKEMTEAVAEPTRLPAPVLIAVSAVFHYLGPAFAVLLFARLDVSSASPGSGSPAPPC